MHNKISRNNNVAIISVSTQSGDIEEYLLYLIKKLSIVTTHICIVSSHIVNLPCKKFLNGYVEKIIEKIVGNDFIHWKIGIEQYVSNMDTHNLQNITLLNDSIYGPFIPLKKIYEEMNGKSIDFWGITRHQAMPNTKSFIQTYFINFNNMQILRELRNFFNNIENCDDVESKLSNYLEDRGYKADVFVKTNDIENHDPQLAESYFLFYPYFLIKYRNCPFISRYMFALDNKIMSLYGSENQIPLVMDYIKNLYPCEYIYNDLIRQHNVYDLICRLKLNYIIEDNNLKRKKIHRKRVAVFVYLYYEKDFEIYISKLRRIPKWMDIYLFTNTECKAERIYKLSMQNNIKVKVQIVDARGREWAVFLNEVSCIAPKYAYGVFLHDKSFHKNEFPTQAYAFRDLLWDNLIPSVKGVEQIINIFEKEEHVGVLLPPIVKHGSYFKYYMNFWTVNYDNTIDLANNMGLNTKMISNMITPISIGGMFWFRVEALQDIFEKYIDRNMFCCEPMPIDGTLNHSLERIIPYIAQAKGYYSGFVISKTYIRFDWIVQGQMIRDIGNTLNTIPDFYCNL